MDSDAVVAPGEIRRRVVMCFDGTWNYPDEMGATGVPAPTNVAKVAVGIARHDAAGLPQVVYYQSGVGTQRFQRVRGGAFGYGLSRNVRAGYRFLVETYRPGDELYFFGFSRGAYTARSAVGLIHNCGILRPEHRDRLDEAYRLYKSRDPKKKPHSIAATLFRRSYAYDSDDIAVHFVGVWDTVGALGIPITGVPVPSFVKETYGFHSTELNDQVRNAYQALAIDEHRGPFKPAVWTRSAAQANQTLEQVWFAGAHRDVGGGEDQPDLSEIPLMWMVDNARKCGLAFKAHHFAGRTPAPDPTAADLLARGLGEWVHPDADGLAHPSLKGLYKLLPTNPRTLGGEGDEKRDPQIVGEYAASTAIDRLPAYQPAPPANLIAWRMLHKEAIDVLGDGELVDPWPASQGPAVVP